MPTFHRNPFYRSVGGSWVAHTESDDTPRGKRFRYVVKQGSKIIKRGPWRTNAGEAFEAGRSIAVHHNVKMK